MPHIRGTAFGFKDGDFVVGGKIIEDAKMQAVILATHRGAVKKMKLSEFEMSSRAKRGVVMLRELKSRPHKVAGIEIARSGEEIVLLTEKHAVHQFDAGSIGYSDRYSNGSFVVDEADTGIVIQVIKNETASGQSDGQ